MKILVIIAVFALLITAGLKAGLLNRNVAQAANGAVLNVQANRAGWDMVNGIK